MQRQLATNNWSKVCDNYDISSERSTWILSERERYPKNNNFITLPQSVGNDLKFSHSLQSLRSGSNEVMKMHSLTGQGLENVLFFVLSASWVIIHFGRYSGTLDSTLAPTATTVQHRTHSLQHVDGLSGSVYCLFVLTLAECYNLTVSLPMLHVHVTACTAPHD